MNEKDKKVKRKKYSDEVSEEEDSFALLEERPQIAAEIDERPALMTGKWKKMTDNDMIDEGNDIYSKKSKHQSQKSAK